MTPHETLVVSVLRSVVERKPGNPARTDPEYCSATLSELDLDSLDKLDIAMGLESAFGVVFVTSEVLKCGSVPEIVAFMASEVAAEQKQR